MHRRFLALCVLALAAGAPPLALAQTAASAPAGTPSAVDPAAVQALKDMGAYLQTLKRFEVETELTGERVLEDGQKVQHSASAKLEVERPNRLRARLDTPRTQRTLYYDGKQATLFTPAQNVYASVPFNGTLAELADALQGKYGIELPLADMFVWGTRAAPTEGIESAMIVGQDIVDGEVCNQYAFRQGKIDWQIWISARPGRPLPRKLVITNRADEARPQSVSLIEWDLTPDFKASSFSFRAPKGAQAIEMVPRKTK
ncbi:MAG TPA: DUF2092 domain-containing protein [Rubrivivax sp.]|nr:DUF2092 domain-containing protein [Rubrivivax sp.]